MKNIQGTTDNLELFNKEGKIVYKFYIDQDGYSYEFTRDSFGNALTFRNSSGFSYEFTRDSFGSELTYKNSFGSYRIKCKHVSKEEYENFINGVKKHTMEELTKLLGYDFKIVK
jgi:hypothetical protein